MASRMTIRFEVDPKTGERNIIVSYESEPDALPMEHEDEHRRLVNQLIEGGVIPAEEAGKVKVERAPAGAAENAEPSDEAEPERAKVEQGTS